jgi:enoyl-CoA hydratase/carnithine racemase
MYTDILYEVTDPVALITLNRPASMNAWTDTMGNEVNDALAKAAADPEVVGVVITGAGRAFCAGADMKTLSNLSDRSGGDRPDRAAAAGDTATATGEFSGRFPYLMTTSRSSPR